jgi:Ser/Thr protein kinase RdoA (MazF antagonist)
VIYYYIAADAQIYLLTLYAKAEVKDLTREQLKLLRRLVEAELR